MPKWEAGRDGLVWLEMEELCSKAFSLSLVAFRVWIIRFHLCLLASSHLIGCSDKAAIIKYSSTS